VVPVERVLGLCDVRQGERVVMRDAVYRIGILPDGTIHGEMRAPAGQRLTPFVQWEGDVWPFAATLEDGRRVIFLIREAQQAPGGWGEISGRLERRRRSRTP
jgi:hypothetical protein